MKRALTVLLLLASCGAPGVEVKPVEQDFAMVQAHLKG